MTGIEECARALADAVDAALPIWVLRSVHRIMIATSGAVPSDVEKAAVEAGRRAAAEIGPVVRDLLMADIDEQTSTPLAVLRRAVAYPTDVLRHAGVPPFERDRFSVQSFPQDLYDLVPGTFADVDPSLHQVAMAWGAAKAMAHRQRHGAPGRQGRP